MLIGFLKRYPFSLVCIALIWVLCFETSDELPNVGIHNIDKLVHFGMYFGTCSTIWWERLKATGKEDLPWLACFAVTAPILMSGAIELLQALTTYRSGDWNDFLANSLGTVAAIPLGHFVLKPIFGTNQETEEEDL